MSVCPKCRNQLTYIEQYSQNYCYTCQKYESVLQQEAQPIQQGAPQQAQAPPPQYQQPAGQQPQYQQQYQQPVQAPPQFQQPPSGGIWFQNFYRIRKKTLTLGNKYWIEDARNTILGFSVQKLFRFKEDIRIYSDESKQFELFSIKQQQILDVWGTFAVIDSQTNTPVGYIRRKALMSAFMWDEWQVMDGAGQVVGEINESSGRGLLRKYLPIVGFFIPEHMTINLHGAPVAEIKQQFKIIGDIWDMDCTYAPPHFDRRVMLGCLLLMGMIERDRK